MSWDPEINRQDAIDRERSTDQPDITAPFGLLDCIEHLRRTAAPRRAGA